MLHVGREWDVQRAIVTTAFQLRFFAEACCSGPAMQVVLRAFVWRRAPHIPYSMGFCRS